MSPRISTRCMVLFMIWAYVVSLMLRILPLRDKTPKILQPTMLHTTDRPDTSSVLVMPPLVTTRMQSCKLAVAAFLASSSLVMLVGLVFFILPLRSRAI